MKAEYPNTKGNVSIRFAHPEICKHEECDQYGRYVVDLDLRTVGICPIPDGPFCMEHAEERAQRLRANLPEDEP